MVQGIDGQQLRFYVRMSLGGMRMKSHGLHGCSIDRAEALQG